MSYSKWRYLNRCASIGASIGARFANAVSVSEIVAAYSGPMTNRRLKKGLAQIVEWHNRVSI